MKLVQIQLKYLDFFMGFDQFDLKKKRVRSTKKTKGEEVFLNKKIVFFFIKKCKLFKTDKVSLKSTKKYKKNS